MPTYYLRGGGWGGWVKRERGGAEVGMGVWELVKRCTDITISRAWRIGAAQHTLRRKAHFSWYN